MDEEAGSGHVVALVRALLVLVVIVCASTRKINYVVDHCSLVANGRGDLQQEVAADPIRTRRPLTVISVNPA